VEAERERERERDSLDLVTKVHKVRNALSVYVCGCGVVLALTIRRYCVSAQPGIRSLHGYTASSPRIRCRERTVILNPTEEVVTR